jgi:hypothetical protein
MTYPSSDVSRTNMDAGTDSPQLARADLDDLVVKFNLLRNHISVFAQGLIDDVDAATARATLGALAASAVSAYGLTLVDDADAAAARATLGLVIGSAVPSPTGAGASGTWGINITGNAATASNGGVTSVNGMTGAVSVTTGVSSLNGQTGAITNTSQDAVGAVEALLYASIGAAITAGTTYAGSSLRRGFTSTLGQNAFDSNASLSGSACSGTWRCMAAVAATGGQYPVALFVRVS